MNTTVFALTLREFVESAAIAAPASARRRAGRPGGHRPAEQPEDLDRLDWMTNTLMDGTMITSVLPLSCLLLGTAAFGNEIDSGTILYLLTKPISRSEIVMAKFVAAASLAAVFLVPAAARCGTDRDAKARADVDVVVGFTIAVALGVLAYSGAVHTAQPRDVTLAPGRPGLHPGLGSDRHGPLLRNGVLEH